MNDRLSVSCGIHNYDVPCGEFNTNLHACPFCEIKNLLTHIDTLTARVAEQDALLDECEIYIISGRGDNTMSIKH